MTCMATKVTSIKGSITTATKESRATKVQRDITDTIPAMIVMDIVAINMVVMGTVGITKDMDMVDIIMKVMGMVDITTKVMGMVDITTEVMGMADITMEVMGTVNIMMETMVMADITMGMMDIFMKDIDMAILVDMDLEGIPMEAIGAVVFIIKDLVIIITAAIFMADMGMEVIITGDWGMEALAQGPHIIPLHMNTKFMAQPNINAAIWGTTYWEKALQLGIATSTLGALTNRMFRSLHKRRLIQNYKN